MRPDEPIGPATPQVEVGSLPRFEYAPDTTDAKAAAGGKAPLFVAVVVALLGLGGGAIIGVLASDGADTIETPAATLPSDVPVPVVDETPVVADPDPVVVADSDPVDVETARVSDDGTRTSRRSRRGDRAPSVRAEPAVVADPEPEPPPVVVEPPPVVADPEPRVQTSRRIRPPPSGAGRFTPQPLPPDPAPQRRGGFVDWDQQ